MSAEEDRLRRRLDRERRAREEAERLLEAKAAELRAANVALEARVRDLEAARVDSEESRRARQAAEAESAARQVFLARMSHELRTPLNGVVGAADLLEDARLSAEERRHLATIRSCAASLLSTIGDILDLSRLEGGGVALERIAFRPADLVEEAALVVAPRAAAKGILLAAWTAPGTPEEMLGDPARLRQVLVNLLGNAVKFTDAGHVALSWRVDGGRCRLEVEDSGIGFDAAARARLFQPFSQGDVSIHRRFGGSGLGLSICRLLVEAMEGAIDVESRPGAGSRFWIDLPLSALSPPAVRPPLPGGVRAAGAPPATAAMLRALSEAVGSAGGPPLLSWDGGVLRAPSGRAFQGVLTPRALRGLAEAARGGRVLVRDADPVLSVLLGGLIRRLGMEPVDRLPAEAALLGPSEPGDAAAGLPFLRRGGTGTRGVALPVRPDPAALGAALAAIRAG